MLFSNTPPPGPQDATVRKRENGTFELLPHNSRLRIRIGANGCSDHRFTGANGGWHIDYHSGFINVWSKDQLKSLNGQCWYDKSKRTQTTPDATFVLKQ